MPLHFPAGQTERTNRTFKLRLHTDAAFLWHSQVQWCIPRGNCLASRHLEAVFCCLVLASASPRPRQLLLEFASRWKLWLKNFFDRPTWNSLLTYLVSVSSCWLLITWSIMDCVLCFIATICISYTLFMNFVQYCCLASASIFRLENFPAASSSPRPRRNCLVYITAQVMAIIFKELQQLYFLKQLKWAGLSPRAIVTFLCSSLPTSFRIHRTHVKHSLNKTQTDIIKETL